MRARKDFFLKINGVDFARRCHHYGGSRGFVVIIGVVFVISEKCWE